MICLPSIARHRGVCLHCISPPPSSTTIISYSSNDRTDDDDDDDDDEGINSQRSNLELQQQEEEVEQDVADDVVRSSLITRLFSAMGGVITLESESDFEVVMVTTCIMGPLYGILKQSRDWITSQSSGRISQNVATTVLLQQYIGALLEATTTASNDNDMDDGRLEMLLKEQTAGGLNEQALANIIQLGGLEGQNKVMDAILSRIRGESDGSV